MSTSTSSGMGVMSWLLIAFILLKILDVEPVGSWSWWWVMAPLWGSALVALPIVLIAFLATRR